MRWLWNDTAQPGQYTICQNFQQGSLPRKCSFQDKTSARVSSTGASSPRDNFGKGCLPAADGRIAETLGCGVGGAAGAGTRAVTGPYRAGSSAKGAGGVVAIGGLAKTDGLSVRTY